MCYVLLNQRGKGEFFLTKEYLVTFKSTTAALKAKMLVEDSALEDAIQKSAEIVSIPYALSGTCFGLGMKCMASEEGIKALHDYLKKEQVDFKNFWLAGKEFTSCTEKLEH